jgi:hypothetical protein
VHAGQQEIIKQNVIFIDLDCSDDTASISRHLKEATIKRTKLQCPLHYIQGDSRDRRQTEYILISRECPFVQHEIAGPILTLLSHLLRLACQVTVLLFFVPLLDSGKIQTILF